MEPRRGNKTLMVIEDEDMLLEMVTSVLEGEGYDLVTCADGLEAIEQYRTRFSTIALVITDLGLPRLGGIELLSRLKEINPHIRTIIASGFVESEEREAFIKQGAIDIIAKPYSAIQLIDTVRTALDTSSS